MNPDTYLRRVETALAGPDGIPAGDRRRVMETLRSEVDQTEHDGGAPAVDALLDDLGSPEDLAASYAAELTDDVALSGGATHGPDLWKAGGAPVFPPKPLGGYSINLGALAARVGLIQPDDDDDRAWAAAGLWGTVTLIALPMSALLTQLGVIASTWGSVPAMVPTHWGLSGTPGNFVPTEWVIATTLAIAAALTVTTTVVVIRRRHARQKSVQPAVLSALLAWAATLALVAAIIAPTAGLAVGLGGMVLVFALLTLGPALALRRGVHHLANGHTPTRSDLPTQRP